MAGSYCFEFLPCSAESQELFDAELSARILQLINVTDSGVHSQVQLYESFLLCVLIIHTEILA